MDEYADSVKQEQASTVPPTVTTTVGQGNGFEPREPRPEPGPWRRHERESARSLDNREHDRLMAAEAFDDESATDADLERLVRNAAPAATGPHSRAVASRMASSCAGYRERPTASELYDAIRAERHTSRQRTLLRMWANEPEWHELIAAWAERVYTLRQLVAALHRAGIAQSRHSRTLNRWAARRDPAR